MITITEIREFDFDIGGYGSCRFQISLKNTTAMYSADLHLYHSGINHKKEISQKEINSFITKLNELEVLNWKRKYDNLNVLDGEQWELMITYNANNRKKVYGNNEYPGSNSNTVRRTSEFNMLLKAIRTLINEPGFFSESFIDKNIVVC